MSSPIPTHALPPPTRTSYKIDQLLGELVSIPGSRGVFRIVASAAQTGGAMSVFSSGSVLSDAPGFHYHERAHDVFLVTKGQLKLWNGDRCRLLAAGDFAYVPPGVVHNPDNLGPHTELLGLVAPGEWIDFFRYVGEGYSGLLVPEGDGRDLKALLVPKLIEAARKGDRDFDVHFVRDYDPPALGDWAGDENVLVQPIIPSASDGGGEAEAKPQPYFLRANTGPRWMLGGVMSRPFIHAAQCGGKFAISSIESSDTYYDHSSATAAAGPLFADYLTFPAVDHVLVVMEGLLRVGFPPSSSSSEKEKEPQWTTAREGQTIVVSAGQPFRLDFASRYVRVISFAGGEGIEGIVHRAGKPLKEVVLPDRLPADDDDVLGRFRDVCGEMGVRVGV